MDIRELTKKIKESASKMTREEKIQLLKDAKIIDESGYYWSVKLDLRGKN